MFNAVKEAREYISAIMQYEANYCIETDKTKNIWLQKLLEEKMRREKDK